MRIEARAEGGQVPEEFDIGMALIGVDDGQREIGRLHGDIAEQPGRHRRRQVPGHTGEHDMDVVNELLHGVADTCFLC